MKKLKHGNAETQFKSGHEAVVNGRKGGLASGQSRRKKQEMKELLEELLDMMCNEPELVEKAYKVGVSKNEKVTNLTVIAAALVIKACDGSIRAFEIIRDIVDGKPTNRIELYDNSEVIDILIDDTKE